MMPLRTSGMRGVLTHALHPITRHAGASSSILSYTSVPSVASAPVSSPFGAFFIRGKKTKSQAEIEGEAAGVIRRPKPTTPGRRHMVQLYYDHLWRGRPVPQLTRGKTRCGGRDSTGRIRVASRGGGNKKLQRFLDMKRSAVLDEQAIVQRIEHDPNRNAHIALVQYANGVLSYILAPENLKAGDSVLSSRTKELDLKPGNCMPLLNIPIGTIIHNLELHPGHGGQLARAAGTSCTLIDKNGRPGYGLVELASKEQRYIPLTCMASIGVVSNPLHKLIKLGKAGRNRWQGRRPHVRGCAMNPVDHPLGGGHSAKGRQPCSKFGVLSKGFKTRRRNKRNTFIVVPRGGIQKGAGGFGGA